MTKNEFLENLKSPLPNAILKKYPLGNIMQFWAENSELYSGVFGQKDDVFKYISGHSGLDIATFHRDKVYAAHNGFVSQIKTDKTNMGGLVVWIQSDILDDNGKQKIISSSYGHLDEIVVKENQRLEAGDLIGYEGNTGFVISGETAYWGNAPAGKGTHLHFGLTEFELKDGSWQRLYPYMGGSFDPLPFFTKDYSGTIHLLNNIAKYLNYLLNK